MTRFSGEEILFLSLNHASDTEIWSPTAKSSQQLLLSLGRGDSERKWLCQHIRLYFHDNNVLLLLLLLNSVFAQVISFSLCLCSSLYLFPLLDFVAGSETEWEWSFDTETGHCFTKPCGGCTMVMTYI